MFKDFDIKESVEAIDIAPLTGEETEETTPEEIQTSTEGDETLEGIGDPVDWSQKPESIGDETNWEEDVELLD